MTQPAQFAVHRESIAGLDPTALVREFGTPLFVYDGATIAARIRELSRFDVVRYAQKANSNLGVLALCRREGALVDAVSAGECMRALRAGFDPASDPPGVVYTADILDRVSLETVQAHGIHVNCGSPDMVDQLGSDAPGRAITLRINPGFGHGHSQKVVTGGETSKHGIWHEQLEDVVSRARAHGVSVRGVHVHIGSGVDFDNLAKVASAVCSLARRVGDSVDTISTGGGLSVPYRDGDVRADTARYFDIWNAERESLQRDFGRPIRLETEPGRFLVAESGCLITEIRAVKRMGSHTYYLVDAGFNALARPVMYGAYHPISVVADGPRETQSVVVGGPLCESGDIFTQAEGGAVETRDLPVAAVGDLLVVECAGAYAFSMSSNYNSKRFAAEVLVDGGIAHLVRERQEFEDMWRGERIPE